MKWSAEMAGHGVGRMAYRAALLLATSGFVAHVHAAEPASDFRILYLEPFAPIPAASPAAQQKTSDDPLLGGLTFDAYGRRFELSLELNARVMQEADAGTVAYRGAIVQQAGSWARLTRSGDDLYGMIADGADLYIIEPADAAREFAVAPLDPAAEGNVIYRLSDTLVNLGADFCEALDSGEEDGATDGLTAFKALTGDLKSHTVLQQAAGATLRLTLSALGDTSLRQRYATEAEARDAILVRLNNIDGIFSAQVGVEIQVGSLYVYNTGTDPFSAETNAGELLAEVGELRSGNPNLRADGLTHLFTGRNLDGNTVGIAYIDALCRRSFGAGLTESRGRGTTIESLIAAHEIGHNFGAVHDGSGECAATPPNQFIMAPQSTAGNDTFSQCSLGMISRSVSRAACITPLPPADVMAAFAAVPTGLVSDQAFGWSLTVTNTGGQVAIDAAVDIAIPAGLTVEDATVAGGSCASGAGTVQCAIGSLAGSESRMVALTLTPAASGSYTVTALVSSANDGNPGNNAASAMLGVGGFAPMPSTTVPPPAARSGGGGTMPWQSLLPLSLLALLRLRRR